MPTSIDRNSKPDTVFLCLPEGNGSSDCVTDVSQYRTDLTDNSSYVDEADSTRTALTCPREVSIVVDLANTDTAILVEHGEGAASANYTYRVRVAAGTLSVSENNTLRASVALPDISGTARKYLIHWSVRPEGASVRTELYARNLSTDAEAIAFATHAEATTSATYDTLTINGSEKLASMTRYYAVRIGRRFHSLAEAFEDWVAERTPPAVTQTRRDAALVPDRSTLPVGDDGCAVGPAHLMAGHVFEQNDRRLVGPLVNHRVIAALDAEAGALGIDNTFAPDEWWRPAPGDTSVRLCASLRWYCPVPEKVNRARVRLFVYQSYSGAGTATAEVRYRCYSMAGFPFAGEPVGPLTYHRTAEATCAVDHDTTDGEWLDLGALPIAVDDWGCTLLAIGISFDEDSPLVADTQTVVCAVTVEPYFEPGESGLDFVDP